MSAGNIDDILARIQRLESATVPKPATPTEKDESASDAVSADDDTDILTPETYTEAEAPPSADNAMEDVGVELQPPTADEADDDDLFSSDESDGGPAMSAIVPPAPVGHASSSEPDSDEAPEFQADAQEDPDADIEFGLDRQSESDTTGSDAATEPEDAAEQVQEGPTEFDPSTAQSEQSAETCESSFDGSSPMADIAPPEDPPEHVDEDDLGASTADAEDDARPQSVHASVIESVDEPSDDDKPTEPAVQGDGMISINPGGANASGMSDLFTPDSATLDTVKRSLADDLADAGISREQVAAAEKVAASTPGKDVAIVLIEQGVDEVAVQGALARHHGLPFERIDQTVGLDGAFDGGMLQRLGIPFCAEHKVLPLRMEGKRAIIASARPDIAFELDEIRRRLNCGTPKIVLTTEEDIMQALEVAGHGSEQQAEQEQVDLNSILEEVDENDVTVEKTEDQTVDLEQKAGESPVIRYVNYIIQTAVKEGASDIHIEPAEKKITVRLRIDGVLYESMNPPANMAAAITSRIKIMANLDISERRIPQDGRIRATVQGRKLDLRVSTLPCGYGEKVVMRILDTKSINVQLEDLGFDENTLEIWKHQVKQPHGIVLVTGPTGSGKTTTLYSSLRQLDKNKLNISTAEDPIEYHLDGITQTQTHEKIGMTFSKVLKALLRQDPDV
ncbi:MAG: ATPase, T2SS/T4P/T4SS family, partial [Planctomycetota bacterium]